MRHQFEKEGAGSRFKLSRQLVDPGGFLAEIPSRTHGIRVKMGDVVVALWLQYLSICLNTDTEKDSV